MSLSAQASKNLRRILAFGLLWVFLGLLYAVLEYGLLGDSKVYPTTGIAYDASANFTLTPFASFLGGVMLMSIDIWIIGDRLKRKTFLSRLLIKSVLFISIIVITVICAGIVFNAAGLEKPLFDPEVLESVKDFTRSFVFWSIIIYIGVLTIICLFIVEIADSFGRQVFWNFFTGRYKTAKVEEKIFMFLDLKDSTATAEELGHTAYYNLLNHFFEDIGKAASKHWGTIYQYVGDEVVIHWPNHKSLETIACYFSIKETIQSNAEAYKKEFGIVPDFRVGIHGGPVAIGEIGSTKKDILYIGDVLNATSRIQGMCKTFDVDILVSEDIYGAIDAEFTPYDYKDMGCTELRGKKNRVNLFAVSKA